MPKTTEGSKIITGSQSRFRLFFTPIGGAVLVIAIVILIRSLLARNSYEIILSAAALLLLLVTGAIGAWKSRKLAQMEPGWKPPFPMTANAGEETLVTGLEAHIPLFFRLHFVVRGRFFPNGSGVNSGARPTPEGLLCRAETSVQRKETSARLPFDFPISGTFLGEGICRLRDIFGFFSFACGLPQQRTIKVRSAPCFGKEYRINAQSGAEDRKNKFTTDEERYYMREYTPGDRLRDINWKSSEKIDALITRISPDTQEKVNRLEIYFRNYGHDKPSLEALWLLDRAKARLSFFLRSLMEAQSSFVFDVRCARAYAGADVKSYNWEIDDQESLDNFLEELAGVSFAPLRNETPITAGTGDIYIFSTACDIGLPAFILASNPRPVSLFLVQGSEAIPHEQEREIIKRSDFIKNGIIPNPRWLVVHDKIKQMGATANRVEMIYTETRL